MKVSSGSSRSSWRLPVVPPRPGRRLGSAGLLVSFFLLLGGCTLPDADPPLLCGPGTTQSCNCLGGELGVQTCAPDGESWEECRCGAPPACTPTAATDSRCDGVDEDCDGRTDEDYTSIDTTCGEGACASTGHTGCAQGKVTDTCQPGAPAAADATCDGKDDDCDGRTDEDFASTETACGTGACAATGRSSCADGQLADSCTPGSPLAVDDITCDGVDDDCDDDVDEDVASVDTVCGTGACAATGRKSCADGQLADSCTPGSPLAVDDITCDGVDDDCDGQVDEDVASVDTVCGTGACAATGRKSCAGGQLADSCTPGSPRAEDDTTCDGVDDDCDGQVDEDFVSADTVFGTGAGASTRQTTCSGGQLADS
ncbi:MAG: MopE-related protein, partial [Myxococcota bacterium]|nr:MopE-related protein [Myxococcota bacterium]